MKHLAQVVLGAFVLHVMVLTAVRAADAVTCTSHNRCELRVADPSHYADWVIPSGVDLVTVTLIGGAGGTGGKGQLPGAAASITGQIKVTSGQHVRLAPGSAGSSAAEGGAGGVNPAGGFAGGAGGRAHTVSDSAGGGGAASVLFIGDLAIVAGGAGGGSSGLAQGGGGGGAQGGGADQSWTGAGTPGASLANGLTVTMVKLPAGQSGLVVVNFMRPQHTGAVATFTNPSQPLDSPRSVAQLAVAALALVASIGGRLVSSDEGDHVEKLESFDTDAMHIGDVDPGKGDRAAMWRVPLLSLGLTNIRRAIHWSSPKSQTLYRLLIDGAYLRAAMGSMCAVVYLGSIAVAIWLGMAASSALDLRWIGVAALAACGVVDALAGTLALVTLSSILIVRFGVSGMHTIEYALALCSLGAVPILAATALRPIRVQHSVGHVGRWERITDFAVIPTVVLVVATGILSSLPVMARQEMTITEASLRIAFVVALAAALRVLGEAAAARWFPWRLSSDHSKDSLEPSATHIRLVALVRVVGLLVVGYTFIGNCWQLFAGVAVFALGQILTLYKSRLPNSPRLWQIFPAGVPGMTLNLGLGALVAMYAHRVLGDTPHMARTTFALCGIPMLLWSVMKACGRHPDEGQIRWYRLPQRVMTYRLGGSAMLFFVLRLNHIV